MTDAS